MNRKFSLKKGFTLVETLVGITVFSIVAFSAYNGFIGALNGLKTLEIKNTALQIANEQIEIVRNLSYEDIGIVNGLPDGVVVREKTEQRNGGQFNIITTIRNVDLPFDGVIGGTPNDISPADDKLVEVEVTCVGCKYDLPTIISARIAPKNLETQGKNGALFVQVVDSAGLAVEDAEIIIENVSASSNFLIEDLTNIYGMLQIVDAPTGTNAYSVSVTKDGYSSERTYALNDATNPIPNIPHANVLQGLVTQLSFSIDKLSNVTFKTKTNDCSGVSNVDFNLKGGKTIGYDVFKTNRNLISNSSGYLNLPDLEWDSYDISITDSNYFLAGTNPMLPINVEPDSEEEIQIVVEERNPNALLINIKDAGNGLPISDAEVTLTRGSNVKQKVTGRGYFFQSDWLGGAGQVEFSDDTKYSEDNNYIDKNNPTGEIKLLQLGEDFFTSANLTSSIIDTGTSSNFSNISWAPYDQNPLTGEDSVKVQLATHLEYTATSTWEFLGPDGTDNTFYTIAGESINATHNGDRFAKYKIFLNSEDNSVTPILSDFSFTYASDCIPPGQVYFDSLSLGDYTLEVEKEGYQTYSTIIPVSSSWQSFTVELTP